MEESIKFFTKNFSGKITNNDANKAEVEVVKQLTPVIYVFLEIDVPITCPKISQNKDENI